MSFLSRVWAAVIVVIFIVLTVLAAFSVMQHDVIFSQLLRQRLAVTVESVARPFRSVVDMGLPVSMMRNKQDLLIRARGLDPVISNVYLFNPTGIIVAAAQDDGLRNIAPDILTIQAQHDTEGGWSLETAGQLISGASILNDEGGLVGGILAVYPLAELQARSDAVSRNIVLALIGLLGLAAGVGYWSLKRCLRAPAEGLRQLETTLAGIEPESVGDKATNDGITDILADNDRKVGSSGVFAAALADLRRGLITASEQYHSRKALLTEGLGESDLPQSIGKASGPGFLVGMVETDVSRSLARRLTPVIAALTIGSAVLLGMVVYSSINASFQPEIARRAQLIGMDARDNVGRSLAAGVPLEGLVGASEYFGHLLGDFPEISYFAVTAETPILEFGKLSRGARQNRQVFPVMVDGTKMAEIVTETDPEYISGQFRDVVLDLLMIVMVVVLFAFELIVVMMAMSVSGPLERLQYLVGIQARGEFNQKLVSTGRSVIARLTRMLSERAVHLNALYARLQTGASGAISGPVNNLADADTGSGQARLAGLKGTLPATIRFCSLSDVRLPVFLFAMADELPLSFFSLYSRSVENTISWLDDGVVIGLPLAAYLLMALLCAPLARPLGQRFGYRNLFVVAAISTVLAKIGLFYANTVVEVILINGLNGIGFALASLACQDYVLDMLPKPARSRSMGLFRATLFAGVFAGTALGGILADRMGQRPVFIVCAVVAMIAAVLIWRFLPVGKPLAVMRDAGDEEETEALSFNLLAPLRDPRFAAIVLGIVIPQAIIDHVFVSYLLSLQMDDMGASVADIARVMMCFFLMLILAGSLSEKVFSQRLSPLWVIAFSSILAGGGLIFAAVLPSSISIFAAAASAGFSLGLAGGPQAVLIMNMIEGSLAHLGSSAVLGAVRVFERGGSIIGLLVVGQITGILGYSGAVGMIGIFAIVGAGWFVVLNNIRRAAKREKGKIQ